MKRTLLGAVAIALIVFAGFLLLPNQGAVQSAVIPVSGMSCGNCAAKITKSLYELEGVESAEVSFEKSEASVKFNATVTNEAAIAGAIEKMGYHTTSTSGTVDAPNATCEPEDNANSSDCCASKTKSSST